MYDKSYILLILGSIFLFIGIWIWKKDREQIKMLEDRLVDKEKSIYELYESLEEIMNEIERIYRNQYVQPAMLDELKIDHGQEESKSNIIDENIENNINIENIEDHIEDHIENDRIKNNIENIIFELSNEGISEEDIARRLGIGKGEVKLILSLKK